MRIVTDPADLQALCLAARAAGRRTALVPTMGFFHAGHLSLMRHARAESDLLAVSLFVNPSQFGPGEDLANYPRDLERDAALAEGEGADILFAPTAEAMYPSGFATVVEVPALAAGLCGRSRPVHFRGVATVVTRLLLLALPHLAVFGEKDWQQLAIIKRLARDLGFPTRIEGRPIMREPDGLALSSRNVYLSAEERAQAPALYQGLRLARQWAEEGERDVASLVERLRRWYADHLPLGAVDYLEVVDADAIAPLDRLPEAGAARALLAAAVRLGKARLIDNILLVA